MTEKKIKIEFAPGCFDSFVGSQQELDELIQEINRMAESGELLENSVALIDDLEYLDDDERDALIQEIGKNHGSRHLQ